MIHTSRRVSFKLLKTLTGDDFVGELELFFKVTVLLRLKILEVVRESKILLKQKSSFYLVCNHTELSLRALSLSLWSLKKNKNLLFEKAFINKYNPNAFEPVHRALESVQKNIKTEFIYKKNMDLTNLDNLVLLLSDCET